MVRLFLAIPLSTEVQTRVVLLQQHLKEKVDIRDTPAANLHCTAVFLGEIPDQRIEQIHPAVHRGLLHIKPFTLNFSQIELVKQTQVYTLWVRATSSSAFDHMVQELRTQMSATLPNLVWTKPQLPHITLGRVSHSKITSVENMSAFELSVSTLILYKSLLTPGGAKYFPLQTYPLAI